VRRASAGAVRPLALRSVLNLTLRVMVRLPSVRVDRCSPDVGVAFLQGLRARKAFASASGT
jgi:hypothetical protein